MTQLTIHQVPVVRAFLTDVLGSPMRGFLNPPIAMLRDSGRLWWRLDVPNQLWRELRLDDPRKRVLKMAQRMHAYLDELEAPTLNKGDEPVGVIIALDGRTPLDAIPLQEARNAVIQALVSKLCAPGCDDIYDELLSKELDQKTIKWTPLEIKANCIIYRANAIWRNK